jgi:hypothetical protein
MRYDYTGYWECDCHCDLEIKRFPDRTVVIATEVEDNEGTSITNMAEHLAFRVCRDFDIDPKMLVWIEHYPDRHPPGSRDSIFDESFDLVTFDWDGQRFSKPNWKPLTKSEMIALIGEVV